MGEGVSQEAFVWGIWPKRYGKTLKKEEILGIRKGNFLKEANIRGLYLRMHQTVSQMLHGRGIWENAKGNRPKIMWNNAENLKLKCGVGSDTMEIDEMTQTKGVTCKKERISSSLLNVRLIPARQSLAKLRFTSDTRAYRRCQNLRFWQLPSARGLALLV